MLGMTKSFFFLKIDHFFA